MNTFQPSDPEEEDFEDYEEYAREQLEEQRDRLEILAELDVDASEYARRALKFLDEQGGQE